MNSLDKKTLKELREKHKDVLENKGVQKEIQFKRDNEENLGYNPNKYPVMAEETYSEKCKSSLSYFVKKLS